jgi:hypothetical protein
LIAASSMSIRSLMWFAYTRQTSSIERILNVSFG